MESGNIFKPKIIGFLCNWCCYGGADLAGVSRYQYPPSIRIIRMMCSGRFDPEFMVRSFTNGLDGVFVGGCWPGECHYTTEGNYDAISVIHICKKLMEYTGLNPDRLRLEWVSASEGVRFAEVMTDFTGKIQRLGHLGKGEGINEKTLKFKLQSISNLLPYIKLVERERLRVRFDNEKEYDEFFASDKVNGLFRELILDKLEINQIIMLLREKPRSTEEISGLLNINQTVVFRHVNNSLKQGIVKFDSSKEQFAIAN